MGMAQALNHHLGLELAAQVRYQGHAGILAFHGYTKLAEKYKEEAGEEGEHAAAVIHRIQQLEGFPVYQATATDLPPALTRWDIQALLESDLETERTVLDSLAGMIEQAEQMNDWETGNVLRVLVTQTEEHITWLATQLNLIKELSLPNYLQMMT